MEYRKRIDVLTLDDVFWTLYRDDTVHLEFDDTSLFFPGYM